ncbi:17714_t:CDS:10 [Entrophospora sp. SA101]|nr:17714_t:CDS:10 [Entrophospora sp. SA101]
MERQALVVKIVETKNNVKRHHKYSEWCITGFLNECEEEPFEIKIDLYIKSLEDIVKHEKGNRAEKAQTLIDRYKKERDAMMNNSGAINGRPQGSVQKTRNGRSIPNYYKFYDETSVSDIKVGENKEEVSSETVASWVLSNGKDVGKVLSKYHLSGEDIEVKNLFTDEEWNEMTQDFKSNVNLNGLEDEQERPIYELMDKITKKPSDLIARIESCVIKLMQLDDLFRHTSFGSNFTNTITRGILTFDQIYHYEEGEIQGLASSVITIMKTKPTDRSLIGQKMYFRISKDQFEMLIGLRPGGLPSAPKSKKWMVKVDLAVVLQDVLINKGIKTMA